MSLQNELPGESGGRSTVSRLVVGAFERVMVLPSTIYIAVFLGLPALFLIFLAVTRNFFSLFRPLEFAGLSVFVEVLTSSQFWIFFGNTLLYAAVAVIGGVLLQLGIALALNVDLPYKRFWQSLLLLPWAIPFVVSSLIWKTMFDPQFGLINYVLLELGLIGGPINWFGGKFIAFLSVIIPTIWIGTPLGVLILLAGLTVIPDDLYEASRIDGANVWQRFRYVTLPLLRPALRTVVLIHSLVALRGFEIIYAMTRGGPGNATTVIAIDIYEQLVRHGKYSYAAAEAVLLILIILSILLLVVQLFSTDYSVEGGRQ